MKTTIVSREYWNVLKGVGIVFVVLGHMNTPFSNFIYLFHMPLFFFISGYLYNEEKYGDNSYALLVSKIKSSWMKYVYINWAFILLHNVFYKYGFLEATAKAYSLKTLCKQMSLALFAANDTQLLIGPLWFVPTSVIASVILALIVQFSRRIQAREVYSINKYIVQTILVCICTLFGYFCAKKGIRMVAEMQISFLVMPWLWAGYLLRNLRVSFEKYLNPIVAIVCAVLIFVANMYYELELVLFMKVYPLMYFVAFMGIYMCMYLAKLFLSIPRVKTIFEYSGEASFVIMASHFGLYRVFDWILSQLLCKEDPISKYLELPNSFPEIWPAYIIIGFVLPLSIYVLWGKLKERVGYEKANLK